MNPTTDTDANVSQRILVQNNVVSGVGRFLPSGNGIFVGNAHHVTVSNNDVFDTYTYAIDVGSTYGNHPGKPYAVVGNAHDNTIVLNHVHDVGQGVTSDIGGIYLATGPQTGNVVQNNVVHDVTHDPGDAATNIPEGYGGWGIYNDASSSNVTWQNNLVYRCSQAPFTFNYGMNSVVQNNVLAFGSEAIVTRAMDEGHLSFTFQNNIVYADMSVWQYGDWTCSAGASTSCYVMKDNVYVDAQGVPAFIDVLGFTKLMKPFTGPMLSFAQWQALGEDPTPSTDSFSLSFGSAASPAFTIPSNLPIPFVPFDPSQAGRTCTTLSSADVPPAFPLQAWPGAFSRRQFRHSPVPGSGAG